MFSRLSVRTSRSCVFNTTRNQVRRNFSETAKKTKKSFYKRKGFWITSTALVGGLTFVAYETNPNGTFGPKTVSQILFKKENTQKTTIY